MADLRTIDRDHTVRWAADADYELIVLEDGCAGADEEVHRVLQEFLQGLRIDA